MSGKIGFGEVVEDAFVGAILFVDLQNAGVLGVGRRKNFRRFSFEENCRVSAAAVDHAADDDHARKETRSGVLASDSVEKRRWASGCPAGGQDQL